MSNRFELHISLPQAIQSAHTEAHTMLSQGVLCQSTATPSRSFEVMQLDMNNHVQEIPIHTDYTTLDCVLLLPTVNLKNVVALAFNAWNNYIQRSTNGISSGLEFRFFDEYTTDMSLIMFNRGNKTTSTYTFIDAYPKIVESSAVSWERSEFQTLPVQFRYSYWTLK